MRRNIILASFILFFLVKGQAEALLEPLYGDFFNQSGVYIQVFSGGCTTKESFVIQKQQHKGIELIYFYRVKPDYCKALVKYGKVINFSYEELGLKFNDRFKVMNPELTPRVIW